MHLYLLSFYSSIMTFLNSVCILPLAPLSFSMVPLKCVLDFKIEYATEGWNNLIYIKEGNQAFFISGTSVLQIASNTLLEFNNNFNNKLHFWYTEFKALIQFYEKKKKTVPFTGFVVVQSLSRGCLFATLWTIVCQAPLCSSGRNTGVGCHFLLQGILLAGRFFDHWAIREAFTGFTLCKKRLENSLSVVSCKVWATQYILIHWTHNYCKITHKIFLTLSGIAYLEHKR